MHIVKRACVGGPVLTLVLMAVPAQAGGFYLQEQSQKEIGRGFSGGAAAADDPATVYYNPAGMTELEGFQVSNGGTLLFITTRQSNAGSTRSGPGATPASPIAGGNGGNPFKPVVPIPSLFVTKQLGQGKVWLGLGVSAPFGLSLGYKDDFFGRYDSLYSSLKTYNVQPSVAVRLHDNLSIGGGVNLQYITVKLTNALPNVGAGSDDGLLKVKGDDISIGWNLGVLAKAGSARLGLHYRSRVKHNLSGTYNASGLTGPLSAGNVVTDLTSPLTLPDIATASVTLGAGTPLRVMTSANFYNWSVFKEIRLLPVGRAPAVKPLNYKDSWSVSLGADYDVSDKLTVRAGTMFDKTPTNAAFLTTRVPDGDRTWASMGASYAINGHTTITASYAHVFIDKSTLNRADSFYAGSAAQIDTVARANTNGNVDMIAISATKRF